MTIRVQSGAHHQDLTVEASGSKSVGEIREELGIVLNIDESAIAAVDDEEVDDDYDVRDGQTVQFIKRSGSKGDESH